MVQPRFRNPSRNYQLDKNRAARATAEFVFVYPNPAVRGHFIGPPASIPPNPTFNWSARPGFVDRGNHHSLRSSASSILSSHIGLWLEKLYMDQMHNLGKSVQIESIGTTCLGIVLLQQQEYTLLLLFFLSIAFIVVLALLSPLK